MKEPKSKKKGCLRIVVAVIAILGTIGAVVTIQSKNYKFKPESKNDATSYSYKEISREDASYGATPRLIVRIRLDTVEQPEKERMISTAKQVWKKQSSKWKECTVFMIYDEMENFNFGAYAIAEFSSSGLSEFTRHPENYKLWKAKQSSSK